MNISALLDAYRTRPDISRALSIIDTLASEAKKRKHETLSATQGQWSISFVSRNCDNDNFSLLASDLFFSGY